MSIYKRKYKVTELIEKLQGLEKSTLNLWELLILVGFNLIDVSHFYINEVKHRIRYERDK